MSRSRRLRSMAQFGLEGPIIVGMAIGAGATGIIAILEQPMVIGYPIS